MAVLAMTDLGAPKGAGVADWELEEFLRRRELDGTLAVLRSHGRDRAEERRLIAREAEQKAFERLTLQDESTPATPQIARLKGSSSTSSLSLSDRLSASSLSLLGSSGSDGDEEWDRWTRTADDGSTSSYSGSIDGDSDFLEGGGDASTLFRLESPNGTSPPGVLAASALSGFDPVGASNTSGCSRVRTDLSPWRQNAEGAGVITASSDLKMGSSSSSSSTINSGSTCSSASDRGALEEGREGDTIPHAHSEIGIPGDPGNPGGDFPDSSTVTDSDLQSLLGRLQVAEDDLESHGWRHVMTRATPTMHYASHALDCPAEGYPKIACYRGRMVLEGVTLEAVRDFLLDDEYRGEWDENRLESTVLDGWNESGECVIRWVRRMPFFLRNREYVVARRVWSTQTPQKSQSALYSQTPLAPRAYYCINRHISHTSAIARPSLHRVPYFYASWRIRYVPGREEKQGQEKDVLVLQGDEQGQQQDKPGGHGGNGGEQGGKRERQGEEGEESGCKGAVEIVTYHQEESGLPRELARVAVSRGMWGHMLKIEEALREYIRAQRSFREKPPQFLTANDLL